jgi:ribosomal protein S13
MIIKKKKEVLIPKFIYEDNYISYYTAPIFNTFLKKIYGFGFFFKKFMYKRFEIFKNFNFVNLKIYEKAALRYFRFYLPKNKDYRYRYYAHLFFLYYIQLYKGFRQIIGLPSRGQRT